MHTALVMKKVQTLGNISKKSCIFAALFFANKDNLKSNTYGS